MKSTIIEMKISLEVFKHRFEQAEESIGELEDGTTEITDLRNIKKNIDKYREHERSMGYYQADQHMHCRSLRRRDRKGDN